MKSVHSCREETLRQTFGPASRSRCIIKNSDSCRHKVCDFMRLHAIACDRCDIAHKRLSLTKNLFCVPTTSQKRRTTHLRVCRSLKIFAKIDPKDTVDKLNKSKLTGKRKRKQDGAAVG